MTKARNIADLGSNDVIETTATGVDVTGTVTADGLTVDGLTTATSNSAAPQFTFGSSHPSGIPLLALKGASSAQIRYLDETNAIQTRLDFADSGKLSIVDGSGNKRLVADSNGDVHFYEDTGTTAKFVWDSSAESLGIGTSSPSKKLDIASGDIGLDSGRTLFLGSDDNVYLNSTSSTRAMRFGTGGSERARIDSSGKLLVGTTDSDVSNNTTGEGTNIIGGNVAIASAGYCLDLNRTNSTVGELARFRKQATQTGSITVTASATQYNTSSDYRLKENVTSMDNASERVKALKPCRFNFIIDPDSTVDGFLAHEAQEVVPEAVHGTKDAMDEDGNPEYQGIDQSKLVPLLTKALQEALTKIEQLESRIETLENN